MTDAAAPPPQKVWFQTPSRDSPHCQAAYRNTLHVIDLMHDGHWLEIAGPLVVNELEEMEACRRASPRLDFLYSSIQQHGSVTTMRDQNYSLKEQRRATQAVLHYRVQLRSELTSLLTPWNRVQYFLKG